MAQVLFLAPARKTFLPSTTNLELFSNCKEHYKMFVKKPQHWQKIVNTEQKNHSVWLCHSPLLCLILLWNWFWKWMLQSTILHFQKQYQRTSQQRFWRWHGNGCGHNLWDVTHGVSDNYQETATIIVMLSRWSKQIHYRSQFKVEV
jgi:hypothetical protein